MARFRFAYCVWTVLALGVLALNGRVLDEIADLFNESLH